MSGEAARSDDSEGDAERAVGVDAQRPAIGDPRPLPDGWDAAWHQALIDWMGVENLEERAAAPGWIDPRVLEFMRAKAEAQ
jgi:hypothetical protein